MPLSTGPKVIRITPLAVLGWDFFLYMYSPRGIPLVLFLSFCLGTLLYLPSSFLPLSWLPILFGCCICSPFFIPLLWCIVYYSPSCSTQIEYLLMSIRCSSTILWYYCTIVYLSTLPENDLRLYFGMVVGVWFLWYSIQVDIMDRYGMVKKRGALSFCSQKVQDLFLAKRPIAWLTGNSFWTDVYYLLPFCFQLSKEETQNVLDQCPTHIRSKLMQPGWIHWLPKRWHEWLQPKKTTTEYLSNTNRSVGFTFDAQETSSPVEKQPPKDNVLSTVIWSRVNR